MQYKLLILALIFSSINQGFANDKKKKSKDTNTENSLMWQISGNKLKQASYLFGTIHAIPVDDYFLGKNTIKKLKECNNLVMELDLSQVDEAKLAQLSLLPDNKTTKDFLSEDEYKDLEFFLIKQFGMNKAMMENVYNRLKPFFVDQFIILSIIGEHKKVYEEELNRIASDNNINKIGLETFDEQLQVIDNIPLNLQYQNLIKNIDEYEKQKQSYYDMVNAYKKQDISYLNEKFETEFTGDMSIYKTLLLDDRNNNWIQKIIPLIQKEACFIAVGAGHLSGEKGLIALLRELGYTVTPLKK